METLNQILSQLGISNNEFLSGGLILGILASVAAYARRLPGKLYYFLQSRFIVTLDISNDDQAFFWLAGWLSMQPYSRRARNLTVTTYRDAYGNIQNNKAAGRGGPTMAPSPGPNQRNQ